MYGYHLFKFFFVNKAKTPFDSTLSTLNIHPPLPETITIIDFVNFYSSCLSFILLHTRL